MHGKFEITGVVQSKEERRRVEGDKERRSWEDVISICNLSLLQSEGNNLFSSMFVADRIKSNRPNLHQDIFRLDTQKILP